MSTCKLNTSSEISLNDSSCSKKNGQSKIKTNFKPKRYHFSKHNMPYFGDPMIISRVQQYINENKGTVLDIDEIVDDLQKKYSRDYAKRKRNAFRGLVEKAFAVVLEMNKVDRDVSDNSSEASDEDFDSEDLEAMEGNDTVTPNRQLMSLYMKQSERRNSNVGVHSEDKELINISSDDESEEVTRRKLADSTKVIVKKVVVPEAPFVPMSQVQKLKSITIVPSMAKNHPPPVHQNSVLIPKANVVTNNERLPVLTPNRKRKAPENTPAPAGPSLQQKRKREVPLQEPRANFSDFGGNTKVLEDVCKLLIHIRHPGVYKQIGVSPPRGFLLHGPPGSGKTLLAHAIAGELGVPLLKVAAPELVAGVSGESEERIRDLFAQALTVAPCVLFLDEVDAITPNRHTAQREMERRIVAQLLSSLDELGEKEDGEKVLVIGATNRPDSIDPALRRAGRFDREVCLGIPDQKARVQILRILTAKLRLAPDFDYERISRLCPGFVGADLMALTREAAMAAVNRVFYRLMVKDTAISKTITISIDKSELVDTIEDMEIDEDPPILKDLSNMKVEGLENDEDIKVVDKEYKANKDKKETANGVKEKEGGNGGKEKKDEHKQKEGKEKKEEHKQKEGKQKQGVKENKEEHGEKEIIQAHEKENEDDSDTCTSAVMELSVPHDHSKPIEEPGSALKELISWLHVQPPLSQEELSSLSVGAEDFDTALKCVQPSAKREGFATVPDVTWEDIGSLQDIREELQMTILAPVRHPEQFASLGLTTATGVLLCGPPGCGKTLLAKAVANEAGINFISVKGPELLNMYVGESERAVRQCFQRARNSAPCVIFFDELDSLCPKRSDTGEGGASMRVVNQMLTEMDGVEERKGVFLMAATNRPDIVDPAVLRPGRLDKILYVGFPGPEGRVDILQALTKNGTKPLLDEDVDLTAIGHCEQCQGYTGADLAALVRDAGVEALKEFMTSASDGRKLIVAQKHFTKALNKIRPSVPEMDRQHYEKLRALYSSMPVSSILTHPEGHVRSNMLLTANVLKPENEEEKKSFCVKKK